MRKDNASGGPPPISYDWDIIGGIAEVGKRWREMAAEEKCLKCGAVLFEKASPDGKHWMMS